MTKHRTFMHGLPFAILLVLDDLRRPVSAQGIRERINAVSGRDILVETIHSAIGNMARDGWIDDAGKGERAGARGRRVTRLFALSKKGKRELDACSAFFLRLVRPDLARSVLDGRAGEGR